MLRFIEQIEGFAAIIPFTESVMPHSIFTRPGSLAFALGLAACSSLTSTTSIAPDEAFRLGGGQRGAFTVRGKNVGPVAIVVFTEVAGTRDSLLTVPAGGAVDASFPAQAMAVFKNTSSIVQASVAITVTGDIAALGMRYEKNATR